MLEAYADALGRLFVGPYLAFEPELSLVLEDARGICGYALGAHVAPLGLVYAEVTNLPFSRGAFIGQHGSWNRQPRSGYNVVFVAFREGKPAGLPVEVTSSPGADNQSSPQSNGRTTRSLVAEARRCSQA